MNWHNVAALWTIILGLIVYFWTIHNAIYDGFKKFWYWLLTVIFAVLITLFIGGAI